MQITPQPQSRYFPFIFVVLISISIFIIFVFIFLLKGDDASKTDSQISQVEQESDTDSDFPEPTSIVKTKEILELEKKLKIERELYRDKDGSYVLKASFPNIEILSPDMFLNDLVESVKFDTSVSFSDITLKAINGSLFPSDPKLAVAAYGTGPVRNRKTKININLLNLNLDRKSVNTGLYEFRFFSDQKIYHIEFESEIRAGKYILSLKKEYKNVP